MAKITKPSIQDQKMLMLRNCLAGGECKDPNGLFQKPSSELHQKMEEIKKMVLEHQPVGISEEEAKSLADKANLQGVLDTFKRCDDQSKNLIQTMR